MQEVTEGSLRLYTECSLTNAQKVLTGFAIEKCRTILCSINRRTGLNTIYTSDTGSGGFECHEHRCPQCYKCAHHFSARFTDDCRRHTGMTPNARIVDVSIGAMDCDQKWTGTHQGELIREREDGKWTGNLTLNGKIVTRAP